MRTVASAVMKAALPALVGATVLLAGLPASAQMVVQSTPRFASPQNFALEFRLGPYSPEIDEEFKGAQTPHQDYFGDDTRLMFQIEFDWQLYRHPAVGSVAIGGSAGYFRETASSPFTATDDPAAERSGDKSRLTLYPVAAVAVYRGDQLWRLLGIPLVPYGKLGLNYTFWSIYDGNELIAENPGGGRGRGGTLGWQAAAGLSLVLDIIDLGSSRELDSETGINQTHLFVELVKYEVSGLGQSNKLRVGDSTWLAGLMFEF
jgi:hypothetical protein